MVALAQSEFHKRPIVVCTELAATLPPVMADRVKLQQVILNLFTNAIDAMDLVPDRSRMLSVESRLGDNDYRKAHLKHWLLDSTDAEQITITDWISSEREPAPP